MRLCAHVCPAWSPTADGDSATGKRRGQPQRLARKTSFRTETAHGDMHTNVQTSALMSPYRQHCAIRHLHHDDSQISCHHAKHAPDQ